MSSLFFVVFSYVYKATLRTDWKFEEEEEAVGVLWDMGLIGNGQLDGKTMRDEEELRKRVRALPVLHMAGRAKNEYALSQLIVQLISNKLTDKLLCCRCK